MRGEGLQPRLALLLCATRAHLLTQAKTATVLLYPNDGNPFPDGCQREGLTQRRISRRERFRDCENLSSVEVKGNGQENLEKSNLLLLVEVDADVNLE